MNSSWPDYRRRMARLKRILFWYIDGAPTHEGFMSSKEYPPRRKAYRRRMKRWNKQWRNFYL